MLPSTAELDATAERLRSIPIPWPDRWQCLRIATAMVLRLPVERVPPRRYGQPVAEWFAEVGVQTWKLLKIRAPEQLPPQGLEPWIAFIHTCDGDHALPMISRNPMRQSNLFPFAAETMFAGLVVVDTLEELRAA
jgi:hypothetical protein